MQIPFLTLPQYEGKTLNPACRRAEVSGGHDQAWQEGVDERNDQIVFDKVRATLKTLDESVTAVALLTSDPNGFANTLYRIDAQTQTGQTKSYFLKLLGRREGNRREVFVWRALGYDDDGKRRHKSWFPGLPPRVFAWPQLNCIMTPYYSGQLPPVRGGGYELPLVLTATLRIHQTLQIFHQHGLLYMDLWPGNILYVERAVDEPISLFLTDMGSVKIRANHPIDGEDWRNLLDSLTPDRRTRQDTKPPEWLFEAGETTTTEPHPGYDFHTLARTALILAGFGATENIDPDSLEHIPNTLNLEDPMAPLRSEMEAFQELLNQPLKGEAMDTDAVYQLFKDYFTHRAQFCSDYIDDPNLRAHWRKTLCGRVNRYKMVLRDTDKQAFPQQLQDMLAQQGPGGCAAELAHVTSLPDHIRSGRYQDAVTAFSALVDSTLIRTSQTARYSLSFHRKILKTIARKHPHVQEWLQASADQKITTRLEQRPEKLTLDKLRHDPQRPLGVLARTFGAPTGEDTQ